MRKKTVDSGFRFCEATVKYVRTETIRRQLMFAFPATMQDSDAKAIARELLLARRAGGEMHDHTVEGYIVANDAEGEIVKIESVSVTEPTLIDVVLEPLSQGHVLVTLRYHDPEVLTVSTVDAPPVKTISRP
jgi:hypothetical protein